MSTLTEVIDSCLNDFLLSGQREPRNVLNSSPDADDTTFTLLYSPRGAQEGARVSVDFEDTYVVSADQASKVLTVIRGQFGTTGAAHTTGATVWVNPKWSYAQVLRAINSELDALSGQGLYRMATTEITFSSPVAGYDLDGISPDDMLDIYEVRADDPGPQQGWRPINHYSLVRDADTTDFPSGLGLVMHEAGSPGHGVRVTYKKRFTRVTSTDAAIDLATSAGLDREAHDLLAIGAAIRLTTGGEIKRNQLTAQPDTRRSEDVPPGATGGAPRWLRDLYRDRLATEKSRLARRYPPRKAMVA